MFHVKCNSFPFLNEVNNIAYNNKLSKDALITFFHLLMYKIGSGCHILLCTELNIFLSLIAEVYNFLFVFNAASGGREI
jgi:hypothetical protein